MSPFFKHKGGIQLNLDDDITYLKGVGPKRSKLYKKMGIFTPLDLLYHFPRAYIDYNNPVKISETLLDQYNVVKVILVKKLPDTRLRKDLCIYKATFTDGEDKLTVTYYNNHFAFDRIKADAEYFLYGKVTGNLTHKEMNSPTILSAENTELCQPVYPLTEGLTGNIIQSGIKQALTVLDENLYDFIPKEFLMEYNLCSLLFAITNIHFPTDSVALSLAKKRLSFDELFLLQLGMLFLKGRNRELTGSVMEDKDITPFYDSLPFMPTNAQFNAISDIITDMKKDVPMNRLIQGDVGSGKTLVAAAACYYTYLNGFQSAFMAPTEILAAQHFKTLSGLLNPLGIKICLLTGSLTPKQKNLLKEQIKSGEYSIIIGTHALIQQSTEFLKLALVITDEQHRFGVTQRVALASKGNNPHKLVMSATPIPRTLGLIIYGDLDISVINEMPKGRVKIKTYAVSGKLRERAYIFIKKELDAHHQGYIVCPMIEESDSDLIAVTSYYKKLSEGAFRGYKLALLHGKMKAEEKDSVMEDFKNKKIDLLISTTVIEVGVDVPNATIMAVENADRFGLSQLHQLRGRVGRAKLQSFCILITDNMNDEVKQRLKIMTETSDGFKIAEEDMHLRGCGDFFGERQHGLPPLKIAELDSEMLSVSQAAAKKIISESHDLMTYPKLKTAVTRLFSKSGKNGFD